MQYDLVDNKFMLTRSTSENHSMKTLQQNASESNHVLVDTTKIPNILSNEVLAIKAYSAVNEITNQAKDMKIMRNSNESSVQVKYLTL